MKLSFVVPAYNESETLEELVDQLLAVKLPGRLKREVVIVEDGSKDDTLEVARRISQRYPEVGVHANKGNKGKAYTVKKGISLTKGDIMIIQDADLEYEPKEIVDLLELLLEKDLDVVYGDRFGKKNEVVYIHNYVGNKLLSFFSNLFTYPRIRVWIPDVEVCYKLMKGSIARSIGKQLTSSRFGLEPEITARLSKHKIRGKRLKFGVVPISYRPRLMEEGKKMNAFRDGVKALWEIVYYNVFK